MSSSWLEVPRDERSSLHSPASCMVLADLIGDGDNKLVAAHVDSYIGTSKVKLRAFKGRTQIQETVLPGIPSAIVKLHLEDSDAEAIAVSCGCDILLYRNFKPYFKFTLPPLEVLPLEIEIWRKFEAGESDVFAFLESLREVPFSELTIRTQNLLALSEENRPDFIAKHLQEDSVRRSAVMCMAPLSRNAAKERAADCLSLVTQHGELMILDSQAFTIIHQARISSSKYTPTLMSMIGSYDVEYRCLVACREKTVCVLRKGWLEGRTLIRLDVPIVGLEINAQDQSAILVLMDKTISCYSRKGRRMWTVTLPAAPTAFCQAVLPHLGMSLAIVSMLGGEIHCYKGRHLVDIFNITDTVSAVTFGSLGQEEHVLIISTNDGSLIMKILKRTARFAVTKSASMESINSQAPPLQLPKKTKLFVEHSIREREQAIEMHQIFQQELWRMRLNVARTTVDTLQSADTSVALANAAPVKLAAQVLGLGPTFRLALQLENMSQLTRITDLFILIHCDHNLYIAKDSYMKIPLLVPGVNYHLETHIRAVQPDNPEQLSEEYDDNSYSIRVIVLREGHCAPLIAAIVQMPPAEV
ncbi:Bardet-Biedl syndrome 1 protein-like [Ctenocephalides felis]|uniref:Bardet-Biedl syndrome 1 protein-like n=1 Tax=Ctenocephalides felis TaxID=7515 RepID=UPI000E6E1500|nr:Bardet-Biedl syndrome 1 protein-like [Ctenocephalides felis]